MLLADDVVVEERVDLTGCRKIAEASGSRAGGKVAKVTTESGMTGWGESHAGRAPGAIAEELRRREAADVVGAVTAALREARR